jgi:hypothetical protein
MSANRKLSENIDKHNAAVMGLVAERDALIEALKAIQTLPDQAQASAAKHLADVALAKVSK